MNKRLAAIVLSLCAVPYALAQHEHHHHEEHDSSEHHASGHDAHTHGVAELTMAVEGRELEIEFESPAANIVGFEHRAKTDQQSELLQASYDILVEPAQLFDFGGVACQVVSNDVDISSLTAAHDAHHDDHQHDESHSEIIANYRFQCASGAPLDTIVVKLSQFFPGLETINVRWVSDDAQGGVDLKAGATIVELR